MKAEDVRLTELLEGPKQFIVPVFQRDYSWGTKHCLQLWKDIVRVGADENVKAHFVGSIVYIAAEGAGANITRWLLIDGQQRLTTLTLLLAALRSRLSVNDSDDGAADDEEALPTRAELDDYYLRNAHGKGDRRYKLHLRRTDHETLVSLLDGKDQPTSASAQIREVFDFFNDKLSTADLDVVYLGIKKLVAVDVSLTRGQDDPQMIFESLNSTGLDLTQADLIRNFVLMRQDEELQTQLYEDYWQPIELSFGSRYRTEFDKFVRDYLTIRLKPGRPLKADEIYEHFRTYFYSVQATKSISDTLDELKRYGSYYAAFSLGQERSPELRNAFKRLRLLVEVASPVVMKLYDCHEQQGNLSLLEFVQAIELLESYVFRRSVCDMQTRSLGQIFSSLANRIDDAAPPVSLKVALYRQGKKRRFPNDTEFRESLETRDVYDMRHCHYLLDRLENDSKEKIETSTLTIEHVMPQNENLGPEWQNMLGPSWKKTQEVWLHRLGNITLTGYNSSYNDLPFDKKKSLIDKNGNPVGFSFSPLRLNKFIGEQSVWTEVEMERRGKEWASRAVSIWPTLTVDMAAVRAAELVDRKEQASKFSLENLEFNADSRRLFDLLRLQILELGDDVIELCGAKTVVYRVYDFFVEVIPRKKRLSLVLNLEFDESDDPSERSTDAREFQFIIYASESGGVVFSIEDESHVAPAIHVVRQAYEKVSG